MRIAVFGAGAVGSHLAARLAHAGHTISVVMRGEHLAAVATNGLLLQSGDERIAARVTATDDAADLGAQDLVLVTLKAQAQPAAAEAIAGLMGPDTLVIFAQNGIPWWFAGELGAADLRFLDPDGRLSRHIGRARVLGGVVTSANTLMRPGVVVSDPPRPPQLVIGACESKVETRLADVRRALNAAGIGSPDIADIRSEIWRKLALNLSASSLALLTGRRSSVVREDAAVGEVARAILAEIAAVAGAAGYDLSDMTADTDAILSRAPPRFPSLLQDRLAGKPIEFDSLFRAPQAIARAMGVATPTFDVIAALAGALGGDTR